MIQISMNLPGFRAEESLYQTKLFYSLVQTSQYDIPKLEMAQDSPFPRCDRACLKSCMDDCSFDDKSFICGRKCAYECCNFGPSM